MISYQEARNVVQHIDTLTAQLAEARRERDALKRLFHDSTRAFDYEAAVNMSAELITARAALAAMRERVLTVPIASARLEDPDDDNPGVWMLAADVRAAVEG